MCGIVGQFDFSGSPRGEGRAFVAKGCEVIAHRGPDDIGIYESEDRRIVLGHRRLSIVDLSVLEVDVLNAQPHAFHEPKSAAVKQTRHQSMHAM